MSTTDATTWKLDKQQKTWDVSNTLKEQVPTEFYTSIFHKLLAPNTGGHGGQTELLRW